jgi:hypothetical protein
MCSDDLEPLDLTVVLMAGAGLLCWSWLARTMPSGAFVNVSTTPMLLAPLNRRGRPWSPAWVISRRRAEPR